MLLRLFIALTLWSMLAVGVGTALGYWLGRLLLLKLAGV